MIGYVARGVWIALGAVFGGFRTALSSFILQVVLTTALVAAGWYFRDFFFDLIGDFIDYIITGLNGVGLDVPSLSQMFQSLPEGILIAMKRVGMDEALAIVGTAVAVRTVMGFFRWIRAFNVLGGN